MRAYEPPEPISPLTLQMINALVAGHNERVQTAPVAKKEPQLFKVQLADPNSTDITGALTDGLRKGRSKRSEEEPTITKSILNILNGSGKSSIERLAFESDPALNNTYSSVYKAKVKLIPDHILKRIAIQDDLVASIVNTRAAQLQTFGRPQPDRFSTGFKIVADEGILDKMNAKERELTEKRIDDVEKQLVTCGHTRGWKDKDLLTFSQYLGMSARNAVTVGRLATEILWVEENGQKKFHSFRPIDAGTIYAIAPYKEAAQEVRDQALRIMEQLKNKDLEPERFINQEYAWMQVIDGRPQQALTEDECVVHNFYSVSDIELDGYPVTPIDTCIAAVTTHINITTHNRMYFQTGRAARGMLIIKSDDVGEETVTRIKHQFQASINNVSNSWRMPVFAVGMEDDISWQSIDSGARDMEFQYLSDTNARVIMSAFQISPEELPGYQHLSRGTNNQALSEGNNEYKLEAARDVGIRPLISQFEDFLNARILPLLDEKLSEFCVIKFEGLDADTPEKESTRLTQDMQLHMVYDEVLQTVEKKPIGLKLGGQIPLNPQYLQHLDKYFTVGEILEKFCGMEGYGDAQQHPELAYRRDPFWFQQVQITMQQQQMAQQAQQAALQQGQPGQGQPGQPAPAQGDPNAQPPQQQDPNAAPDLSTGIEQVMGMLSKSEAQLPPSRRRLLEQQRQTVTKFLAHMEDDLAKLSETVMDVASDFHKPKG